MSIDFNLDLNGKAHVIRLASAPGGLQAVLEKSASMGKKVGVAQFFDPGAVASRVHLSAAFLNAEEAFKSGANITNSKSMEMLLFAAMTTQISDAIAKVGAKNAERFVVFAESKKAYSTLSHMLADHGEFRPTKRHQAAVAGQLGIKGKDSDLAILGRMAMSRLAQPSY